MKLGIATRKAARGRTRIMVDPAIEMALSRHWEKVGPKLLKALRDLECACVTADAKGELPEEVDGSYLDNAKKAIIEASEVEGI